MDLQNPPQAAGKDQLELALERELESGERVRWKGRGQPQGAMTGFGMYLFAIPWTAFALFWTAMAWSATGAMDEQAGFLSYAFPLFGLPFIAVGIFMLATPFLAMFKARKTLFAVTSQRLLRITITGLLETESIPADRIGSMTRKESRDGSGSLSIAIGVGRDSDGDKRTEDFTIGKVADVMGAENAVRRLLDEAKRGGQA
ncbi:MAG: hypothetical protein H6918_05560 [Sphingomonadaceae bacterium]|nr:hypothetical protein [Sphingomonadaceae bacterium]